MPYRHWFVVLTVDGVESRIGPYATRRTAERKSEQHHGERSQRRRKGGLRRHGSAKTKRPKLTRRTASVRRRVDRHR